MTDQFVSANKMVPPREIIEQWANEKDYDERDWLYEIHIANCAAAWGANQQLIADAKWLDHNALNEPHLRITPVGESLKEAMRPKSIKERALHDLHTAYNADQIDDLGRNSMTNQQHPITPPPELVEQWRDLPEFTDGRRKMIMVTLSREKLLDIATQAARWGADQELGACCHLLRQQGFDVVDDLRATRRPKLPSLKEQALSELNLTADPNGAELSRTQVELIRRALEQLND
jgi:hypothetical protein